MVKICSNCHEEKEIEDFNKRKSAKDGHRSACKLCQSLESTRYRESNSEKLKIAGKVYYTVNKQKIARYQHDHYVNNRDEKLKYSSEHFQKNKEHLYEIRNKNARNKRQSNPAFQVEMNLRSRFANFISKGSARHSAFFGATPDAFRDYLESQFTEGMSWDNHEHSGWHVDHIIPISYFNLLDDTESKICFNWRNTQPLWKEDNFNKHDTLPDKHEELYKSIKEAIEGEIENG